MFFRGCVNIVAQSFSQLRRTKTADVSRILGALGAPSTTRTDLQAFTLLPLLISTHYFCYCRPDSLQTSKDIFLHELCQKWKSIFNGFFLHNYLSGKNWMWVNYYTRLLFILVILSVLCSNIIKDNHILQECLGMQGSPLFDCKCYKKVKLVLYKCQ